MAGTSKSAKTTGLPRNPAPGNLPRTHRDAIDRPAPEQCRTKGSPAGFSRQHNRLQVFPALVRLLERHIATHQGQ
jgi:hypothetical protein